MALVKRMNMNRFVHVRRQDPHPQSHICPFFAQSFSQGAIICQ